MKTQPRETGIGVVGDIPWGTHFFLLYETREDLLDTLRRAPRAIEGPRKGRPADRAADDGRPDTPRG